VAGLFFFCMCCSSHFAGKIIYNSRIWNYYYYYFINFFFFFQKVYD
jgi:hypothetical protein